MSAGFRSSRVVFALVVATLAAYFALRLVAFARVLPGHDFVGDTYWVDYFARELGAGRFPHWTAMDGLGHPTTVQRGSILLFLPVVMIKAVVGDTVLAAKLWYALLHTLSFATFFGLARRYGASRDAATLAAFAYLLAPLHVDEIARGGHWQLATSFFLAPWILSSMIALLRDPRPSTAAKVALLVAWLVLADNERAATLLPIHASACAVEACAHDRKSAARRLGALVGAVLLGTVITAWLTVPLFIERASLNLLRSTDAFTLFADRIRVLRGPLFALDHGSWLGDVAPSANAFGVHAGWLLVGVGVIAVVHALVARDRHALLGAIALSSLWLATWNRAWCSGVAHCASFACVAIAVAFFGVRRGAWTTRGAAIGVTLLCIVAFVPSATLLGHVPPFATLGNKLWFLTVALPLVLSIAIARLATESERWSTRARGLLAFAACVLAAGDAIVGTPAQTSLPSDLGARMTHALTPLGADATPSRYLPYPYVEADAVDSFALRFSPKPSASSWLLWACGRWGVARIARAYASVDHFEQLDADAGARALDGLAAINVRYLVVPRERVDALTRTALLTRVNDGDPAVLESTRWTHDASVTFQGAPVPYVRSNDEGWSITPTARGEIVVAEAWYPYWKYEVGGVTRATRPTADGLIAVDVDADGPVSVIYEPPALYRALRWSSGLALLVAIALLFRRARA